MPAQYFHPSLGSLQCLSKGQWKGLVQHGPEEIELLVAGSESAPNPALVNLAASVLLRLPKVRAESLHAVKAHAIQLGWLDLGDSTEWEVVGLECLNEQQPSCFDVICYEGIKDIYGWWKVAWNDQVLDLVSRVDA